MAENVMLAVFTKYHLADICLKIQLKTDSMTKQEPRTFWDTTGETVQSEQHSDIESSDTCNKTRDIKINFFLNSLWKLKLTLNYSILNYIFDYISMH